MVPLSACRARSTADRLNPRASTLNLPAPKSSALVNDLRARPARRGRYGAVLPDDQRADGLRSRWPAPGAS